MIEQAQAAMQGILAHCAPTMVILYGTKQTVATQQIKSIDLCIITPNGSEPKDDILRRLYLNIDLAVPFQLMVYTADEWDELTQDESSYAAAILKKGTILYEQRA